MKRKSPYQNNRCSYIFQIEFLGNKLSDIQKQADTNQKKQELLLSTFLIERTTKRRLRKGVPRKTLQIAVRKRRAHSKTRPAQETPQTKRVHFERENQRPRGEFYIFQKEKHNLQEQLYQAESRLAELENKFQKENLVLKQKLEQQSKSQLNEKLPLKAENDKLKAQVEKLEQVQSDT
jgi:hypothetical protein